ncbi:MAG TPA: hypothetical protein PK228_10745 [Saprospiraceae bacterium]|nr:hypothetical protein [Saprospiraceae bacterium]
MQDFSKWATALLVLFFSLAAQGQTDSLPEAKPAPFHFQGYLKDLQTASFTTDKGSLLTGNLLHNRLNFRYDFSQSFSARLELRSRLFWGEQVRWTPGFSQQADYENGWMDLSWIAVDEPAVVLHIIADRLSLNWQKQQWNIVAGRQRVNWGVATVWNPNDLFNTYNYFDFDYEERPGSDAVRVRYFTGGMSGFDLAVAQGKDAGSTIAALLYRFNRRGYDFQAFGSWYKDDLALGGGWAGSIGDAGFKGEATWFQPRSSFWDTTGLLSVTLEGDYTFEGGWYVGGSFLYTSGGSDDAEALDQLATYQFSAKTPMPFKYSVLGQVTKQVTPLFTTNLSVTYCPGADALIIFPVLTYSVSDNWDVNLVVQSYFAPQDGTFKNRGNALIFRLKWGF